MSEVITGVGPARSGVTLMARVTGNNGQPITQASLSTITYTVTNLGTGVEAAAVSLTIASVVFDNLQQGNPRWTVDSADAPGEDGRHGYNFLATIPASDFPAATAATTTPAAIRYQVDVRFVPTSGEAFIGVFQFTALPVYA